MRGDTLLDVHRRESVTTLFSLWQTLEKEATAAVQWSVAENKIGAAATVDSRF